MWRSTNGLSYIGNSTSTTSSEINSVTDVIFFANEVPTTSTIYVENSVGYHFYAFEFLAGLTTVSPLISHENNLVDDLLKSIFNQKETRRTCHRLYLEHIKHNLVANNVRRGRRIDHQDVSN
jgi:hypothetical protein